MRFGLAGRRRPTSSRWQPGPAAALDLSFAVRHVVVGQLFALADIACGADPDHVADDVHVAVAFAGVIDEARQISADSRIAHPAAIDLEAPDRAPASCTRFAPQAFLMRDLLAGIIDNSGVFRDRPRGKHSPSMQLRTTTSDHGLPFRAIMPACSLCQFGAI